MTEERIYIPLTSSNLQSGYVRYPLSENVEIEQVYFLDLNALKTDLFRKYGYPATELYPAVLPVPISHRKVHPHIKEQLIDREQRTLTLSRVVEFAFDIDEPIRLWAR